MPGVALSHSERTVIEVGICAGRSNPVIAAELDRPAWGLSSCLCKRAGSGCSDVGVDAVGVDEGELLEGLFPVRGDLAFDEAAGCSAFGGG